MHRDDKRLEDADAEIRYLYASEKVLKQKNNRIKEIDALLDGYGVNTPKIRSTEEAKCQRGTKIYSDVPLLELFDEQDRLIAERDTIGAACGLIREKLNRLNLSKSDERLLFFIYVRGYRYKSIAYKMHYSSKTSIQKKHDKILKAYSEL